MIGVIIEYGLVAAFGVTSPQFGPKDFQTPYLLVEQNFDENKYFFSFYNSARTGVKSANTWHPGTALWKAEAGVRLNGFSISAGHKCEHEIAGPDLRTESYDFAKVSYRIEL